MKKTTLAIIFTILITLSCIFYSCNADRSIFFGNEVTETTDTESDRYESIIKELEDQIIELKQNQYISDAERNKEIQRLEALISKLSNSSTETDKGTETDSATDKDTDSNTDTNTDTDEKDDEIQTKFLYTLSEEGYATITGFIGNDVSITIPSDIDGHSVFAIGDNAFQSSTIKHIIIPDSVTKIGWFAFEKCPALSSVTIPKSVTSIGYSAFPSVSNGLTIICDTDSFAYKYAESYGINCAAI